MSGLAPKSRVRRTVTYKVVWYVKSTTFIEFNSRTHGPNPPVFTCNFAVVRTADAAIRKMVEFGLPMVRTGPAPEGFVREKHVGTAKTKPGFYWRSPCKSTTISATPYRVE